MYGGSWNEIKHISLVHSWRKLLDHSRNEFQESREEVENCEIVHLLKKIPGCNLLNKFQNLLMVVLEKGWGTMKTVNFLIWWNSSLGENWDKNEDKSEAKERVDNKKVIIHTTGLQATECSIIWRCKVHLLWAFSSSIAYKTK